MGAHLLTVRETSQEFGLSESHVRHLIGQGKIEHLRLGVNSIRITRKAFKDYLNEIKREREEAARDGMDFVIAAIKELKAEGKRPSRGRIIARLNGILTKDRVNLSLKMAEDEKEIASWKGSGAEVFSLVPRQEEEFVLEGVKERDVPVNGNGKHLNGHKKTGQCEIFNPHVKRDKPGEEERKIVPAPSPIDVKTESEPEEVRGVEGFLTKEIKTDRKPPTKRARGLERKQGILLAIERIKEMPIGGYMSFKDKVDARSFAKLVNAAGFGALMDADKDGFYVFKVEKKRRGPEAE